MKNFLSTKHFIILILATTLISIRTYSSFFIKYGQQNTWIYLLIALLILVIFFYFIINTLNKLDSPDFVKSIKKYLPKPISTIFLFLFAIGLLLNAIESTAVESNFIYTNLFLESSIGYYILLFIIPSIYLLTRKFSSVLIFIIVSFSLLLLNDAVFAILIEPYKNYRYIFPILHTDLNIDSIKCILFLLGSLSSICIVLPYSKLLNNKKNLKKNIVISLLFISFITVFSTIGIIATLGSERCANIFYPGFIQSDVIHILEFIEFGEFFYIFRVVIGFFIKYILSSYAIFLIYHDKIKSKKVFFSLFLIVVFVLSYLISNNNYRLFYFFKYFEIASIILLLLIPLISCFIISIKLRVNSNQK
ncbi:GerAB/ArcD/ProY family transporter [Clostridium taeniosporum]|uniref:Spore gernimation protein n=1 Tax=Clostridium taeniosporum TaxID=394958 RepID=A0A1D7XMG5_9CLOT|nr:GerAB/ArcD/ProY family transporter [Clostridium taeniosporum]AOR24514.1 spore gernimation protein [Clostridium taeniosporum]